MRIWVLIPVTIIGLSLTAESCASGATESSSDAGGDTATTASTAPTSAAGDPHAVTPANISASLRNNEVTNANFDHLQVTVPGAGQVVIVCKPGSLLDEQYTITVEAENALSAVKAIKGWYSVSVIHMQLDSDFTDSNGNTKTEPAAWIELTNTDFSPLNADGLATPAFEQPSRVFAKGSAYYIHPAVFNKIKSVDQNALNDQYQSGTPLIANTPG